METTTRGTIKGGSIWQAICSKEKRRPNKEREKEEQERKIMIRNCSQRIFFYEFIAAKYELYHGEFFLSYILQNNNIKLF